MLATDKDREKEWKSKHSLAEFTAPTNFKSYDELKKRLDTVLTGTVTVGNASTTVVDEPTETVTVDTKEEPAPTVSVTDDDEDDTIDYFQKLADDE